MWCTLLFCMNRRNSSLVKLVPLSVTSCSGSPNVAKVLLIFLIVTTDVDDFVMCTFIYLECASMRIRNMCPKRDQHNSRDHSCSGHSHGWSGAAGGFLQLC